MNWLLLRGLMRTTAHWGGFERLVQEAFPGGSVLCLDFPGLGTEQERACPLRWADLVQDLRARWEPYQRSAAGPWGCLGLSLGGMTALHWASLHSKDFTRLVTVNSSSAESPPWQRIRPLALPQFTAIVREKNPVEREWRVLQMTTQLLSDTRARAETFAPAPFAKHPWQVLLKQLALAGQFRVPKHIEAEVRVLASQGDVLVNPLASDRIAKKLGVSCQLHTTAGHDLPADDPDWVLSRMRNS